MSYILVQFLLRNQAVFKDGQADLLAQTIRWWDHDFFSGNLVKMTLCTTGCAELLPKYPVFLEGVLELLCRDAQCPSWKYDNGRFFKITPEFRKHSVNQSDYKKQEESNLKAMRSFSENARSTKQASAARRIFML